MLSLAQPIYLCEHIVTIFQVSLAKQFLGEQAQ